jgi:hypothetical protein
MNLPRYPKKFLFNIILFWSMNGNDKNREEKRRE